MAFSRVAAFTVAVQGVFLLNAGCETNPPLTNFPLRDASPSTTALGNSGQKPGMFAGRVLRCEPNPAYPERYASFAVDYMTTELRNYPAFAEYAGLSSVASCEDALVFVHAFDQYAAAHPNFYELPPETQSGSGKKELVPQLRIAGGSQLINGSPPESVG